MSVFSVLHKKLARDLWAHKGAYLALSALMVVGISGFVAYLSTYRDMLRTRDTFYNENRLSDFSVSLRRAPEWAVDAIKSIDNVRDARGSVRFDVLIDIPDATGVVPDDDDRIITGTAISMPLSREPVINDVLLMRGSWFRDDQSNEVVVDEMFAKANHLSPGDRIFVNLLDSRYDLLIVGTALSPEFVYLIPPSGGFMPDPELYGVLYFPDEFLQAACDLKGSWNYIVGSSFDSTPAVLDATLKMIEDRLDAYGVLGTVRTSETASVRAVHDEMEGLRVGAVMMPIIFLGIAALIINIVLSRQISKERTMIGTLRALGCSKGQIIRHYLAIGLLLGFVGAAAGTFWGLNLQAQYCDLYETFYAFPSIDPTFYPDTALLAFAIGAAFALSGAGLPAFRTASLNPAVAMRPPPPEIGKNVFIERFGFLWKRLPFRWKMILRHIIRNPFRSSVSVGAAFISTAIIFMTLNMFDALDYLMEHEFKRMMRQDATLLMRFGIDERGVSEIERLPSVSTVETQFNAACDFVNGARERRLGVMGLPRDARLQCPIDSEGNPIVIPDAGLTLSKKFAEILDLAPGDTVRLRALTGERRTADAPVIAVVDTYLGVSAYAERDWLARLFGETGTINAVLVETHPGDARGELLREVKRRPMIAGMTERSRAYDLINKTFGDMMGVMILSTIVVAGLIAFGTVYNMTRVSVSEREREIGTLRVLGFSTKDVSAIFTGESFLLNTIGVGLGMFGGIGFSALMIQLYDQEMYRFPLVLLPSQFVKTGAAMLIIVLIAQRLVLRMIRKFNWLDALKIKE